jgi:hypothetical protein
MMAYTTRGTSEAVDFVLVCCFAAMLAVGTVFVFIQVKRLLFGSARHEFSEPNEPARRREALVAFPVVSLEDGAGQYRLSGVLRESEEEVAWLIDAESRANAIAKAEIRGMVVTQVAKTSNHATRMSETGA